jgi:hypothetical protein
VIAPKVIGAGHLDALTRDRALDYFVPTRSSRRWTEARSAMSQDST